MAGSYVTVGSGDHHVIALHGWFGSALGWGHLADYLNTVHFSYVFPDLRGYGSRRGEEGEFTMAEAAADAIALADDLGWDRFSVIGHSMSGVAVQHILRQAPDRVRRLAGIVAQVKGCEVPVKVIAGEYDPTQPAEFMEQAWLQVYPNSELEVLRGAGHYAMFETPPAAALAIEEFLARG